MEKGLVRQILYKEGFKSVKIKETLGYDLTADNCLIEVKETKNLKYFNKNRYSYHSDEQKNSIL